MFLGVTAWQPGVSIAISAFLFYVFCIGSRELQQCRGIRGFCGRGTRRGRGAQLFDLGVLVPALGGLAAVAWPKEPEERYVLLAAGKV